MQSDGTDTANFFPIDDGRDIYRQMFDHSVVPVIIHDMEMNIIDVNQAATRLFGYERETFLQKSIFDLHTESELGHSECRGWSTACSNTVVWAGQSPWLKSAWKASPTTLPRNYRR
jgi:PAS domain-containing protein